MRVLLALLAMAGSLTPDTVTARTEEGGLALERAVCGKMPTIPGPNPQMAVYPGPGDQNGSGVLTLLNCTGATLVKAHDLSPKTRDRAPFVYDASKTEKIPGMQGRYHYLNFNQPELGHIPVLEHWSYTPPPPGTPWGGACVHPVEFTMRSGTQDNVFVNDVDICRTDILIIAWSAATR